MGPGDKPAYFQPNYVHTWVAWLLRHSRLAGEETRARHISVRRIKLKLSRKRGLGGRQTRVTHGRQTTPKAMIGAGLTFPQTPSAIGDGPNLVAITACPHSAVRICYKPYSGIHHSPLPIYDESVRGWICQVRRMRKDVQAGTFAEWQHQFRHPLPRNAHQKKIQHIHLCCGF